MRKQKICIVCSSGGHLLQFMQIRKWWREYDRFWVTFNKPDAISLLCNERVYWGYHPTTRSYWNLFRNTLMAFKLLLKESPDVIISTGAGIAIPYFYIGKLLGKKTIFIDAFNRIHSPTVTGKVVEIVTDEFFVQWEEQKKFYKKAEVIGRLI